VLIRLANENGGSYVVEKGGREAEPACDRGHGRDDHQRIVARDLHPLGHGGLVPAAERVVDAGDVGQEHRVERAVLQQLR
jgi:hypothetical protein